MTFRKLKYHALCSLGGIQDSWLRPSDAKAKYVELTSSDLLLVPAALGDGVKKAGAAVVEHLLPIIPYTGLRHNPCGNTFLVVFNPACAPKSGATHVVEGERGTNILASFDSHKINLDKGPLWILRIYELQGDTL